MDSEDIGYVILVPIVCAIGISFNILNLIIFFQRGFQSPSYTYLTTMAAADLVLLVTVLPIGFARCSRFRSVFFLHLNLKKSYKVTIISIPFYTTFHNSCKLKEDINILGKKIYETYMFIPFSNMAGTSSVWVTAAVTIERYIYIRKGIMVKNFKGTFRARLICGKNFSNN